MAKYTKTVSVNELKNLSESELKELKKKLIESELLTDSETFQPYKVVDGVRYNLEILMDNFI